MSTQLHLVMPMGGRGSRFFRNGYNIPKPLIEIKGKPFFYWSTQSILHFIQPKDLTFVVLNEHNQDFHLDKEILRYYPEARIIAIPEVLDGAVLTCLEGIKSVVDTDPILFNDCDHLFVCDGFYRFCNNGFQDNPDGALLTFQSAEPKFSFIKYNNHNKVIGTVEKQVVSADAICGAYYFKSRDTFENAARQYLIECNYSEFFVSGLYNVILSSGGAVRAFPTNLHITFGTPEEYLAATQTDGFERVE